MELKIGARVPNVPGHIGIQGIVVGSSSSMGADSQFTVNWLDHTGALAWDVFTQAKLIQANIPGVDWEKRTKALADENIELGNQIFDLRSALDKARSARKPASKKSRRK